MNFADFGETIRRQWLLVVTIMIVGFALFLVALPHLQKYTATSTLLAASPGNNGAVLDPSKDPISSAVGLGDLQSLATSSVVVNRVIADLRLTPEEAAKLPSEIKAKSLFGSNMLPLQVSDRIPGRAIAAVNALATELTAYDQHVATGRYDQLIHDLQQQLAERRRALAAIDSRIQGLTAADYYVSPDTGTSAINTRLIALKQQEQQLQATAQGDAATAAEAAKRPSLSRHLASHEIVAADPVFSELKTQYGKDLANLNNVKAGYTENYPGLAGLKQIVKNEDSSLSQAQNAATQDPTQSQSYVTALLDSNRANAALASDRAQLNIVEGQLSALENHLAASGSEGSAVSQLRRERTAGESAYNELSSRLAQAIADRSQAASIGSVVVVDRATGASPSTLGNPVVLATAFGIVFLWLGITLAFVMDGADNRLRTPEAVEELYGKPVFTPVG